MTTTHSLFTLNKNQVDDMEHALRNGNRFNTNAADPDWIALVNEGLATKHPGWSDTDAYFRVTREEEDSLRLTDTQRGQLRHCFGLDYTNKPYRNYYHSRRPIPEWEDLVVKGYATKDDSQSPEIIYTGTLKALRTVYRQNITKRYLDAIYK